MIVLSRNVLEHGIGETVSNIVGFWKQNNMNANRSRWLQMASNNGARRQWNVWACRVFSACSLRYDTILLPQHGSDAGMVPAACCRPALAALDPNARLSLTVPQEASMNRLKYRLSARL